MPLPRTKPHDDPHQAPVAIPPGVPGGSIDFRQFWGLQETDRTAVQQLPRALGRFRLALGLRIDAHAEQDLLAQISQGVLEKLQGHSLPGLVVSTGLDRFDLGGDLFAVGASQRIGSPSPHVHHDRRLGLIRVKSLEDQVPQRDSQGEDPLVKTSLMRLFLGSLFCRFRLWVTEPL